MSENLDLFVFEFGNKTWKLKESQLTLQLIGKILNVSLKAIVLVTSDGIIEMPDERGCFSGLCTYMDYEVQRDSCISRDYSSMCKWFFLCLFEMTLFAYETPKTTKPKVYILFHEQRQK